VAKKWSAGSYEQSLAERPMYALVTQCEKQISSVCGKQRWKGVYYEEERGV